MVGESGRSLEECTRVGVVAARAVRNSRSKTESLILEGLSSFKG